MKKEKNNSEISTYLNEIAERLWSHRASVMIGSGFSKNAKKNKAEAKDFPSWHDLGDAFYEKLHGVKPEKTQKYLDPLRLASEVQAALGRPTLNQILLSEIPDDHYEPSVLHEDLLKLPWEDVFTTNYDTLLERTAKKVKNYITVFNKHDLIWSKKPRIIKLHGSFSSAKPFIITEEDYRTYPDFFAPFVNTVQQSLIENTLCLIGFSGNDPNFLNWTGWIRDNLGKDDSLRMFLIDVLDLSVGQRRLLEDRNIIPVDLSLLPANRNKSHYEALSYFVDFLNKIGREKEWIPQDESRSSTDEKDEFGKGKRRSTADDLGVTIPLQKTEWDNENKAWLDIDKFHDVDASKDIFGQIKNLIEKWKMVRKNYPNWIILPQEYRKILSSHTQHLLIREIQGISPPLDIEYLYEFNWRRGKCLNPLLDTRWIDFYEHIINKYNPFPTEIIIENAITPKQNLDIPLNWSDISVYWLELQLSILPAYRHLALKAKWRLVAGWIDKIKKYLTPEQLAKYRYERCLFGLFLLDIKQTRSELDLWESNFSLPFWEAKRAGLIAELGNLTEAISILEQALINIREKLNLSTKNYDYSLLSQEACILYLLRYIKGAEKFKQGKWYSEENEAKMYNMRLDFLQQYKCNPIEEIDYFSSFLKEDVSLHKRKKVKYKFDIGDFDIYDNDGRYDIQTRKACSLLFLLEELGVPFKIQNSYFELNTVNNAVAIISDYYFDWALMSCIRNGDRGNVNAVINRRTLVDMTQKGADCLAEHLISTLEKSEPEITRGDVRFNTIFAISLSSVVPEILSRLCVKCSYDTRMKILNFIEILYNSDNKYKYRSINNLVHFLIYSFSFIELHQLLPRFLKFPIIIQEKDHRLEDFVDPLSQTIFLENQTMDAMKIQGNIEIDNETVEDLINCLSDIEEKRKTAFMRLVILYFYGLLTNDQINKFSTGLWSNQDDFYFPSGTNFYYFAFLDLPHPNEIEVKKLFSEYITKTQFPIQQKNELITMAGGDFTLFNNIIGATNKRINYCWNKDEVNLLIERIIEWWNADKEYLKKERNTIQEEFKARFNNMISVFIVVISSNIKIMEDKYFTEIKRIISELADYGMPDLAAKASFIGIFPQDKSNIMDNLLKKFNSKNESDIKDSINAVHVFLQQNYDGIHEIAELLAGIIKHRADVFLDRYITLMVYILKNFPSLITIGILDDLFAGLGYLIDETRVEMDDEDDIIHTKLQNRILCAKLTSLLKSYLSKNEKNIPQCILDWEKICNNENEFSEIRTAWSNYELLWKPYTNTGENQ
jgi:hypothetical protein